MLKTFASLMAASAMILAISGIIFMSQQWLMESVQNDLLEASVQSAAGVQESDLRKRVEAQLSVERRHHTERRVRTCLRYRNDFEEAARLTHQPTSLLVAVATIESGGCKDVGNHEAKGFMQVHRPSPEHMKVAAELLRVDPLRLDYIGNRRHNLVLGAVILNDYTRHFGNVADGLEAYNQGPSNVEVGDHSDYPKYVVSVLATAEIANH
ncbi:MAG: hypothetical protein QG626_372 [Patescibacteria group bacterium]|jgi:hypothetical protein|nr:hypothetical protein [Patescibacteria group bacterium]